MVPTAGVRDDLLAHGFDPAKVMIWSRGVDLEIFKPAATGVKADETGPRDDQGQVS